MTLDNANHILACFDFEVSKLVQSHSAYGQSSVFREITNRIRSGVADGLAVLVLEEELQPKDFSNAN